jgi:prolyl 4-hydroxylase
MNTSILCERPLVTIFEDFLDSETCKKFIEYPWPWVKSTGYDHDTLKAKPTAHRTSSTNYIYENLRFYDFVAYTKAKISQTLKVRSQRFEFLQMQKYAPGEQYKEHYDYFFHGPECQNNRVGTLIIYLNDDFSGGGTTFHKLDFTVLPKTGRALYFQYNYEPDVNLLTEHSGDPILEGNKYIVTAWFRNGNWSL